MDDENVISRYTRENAIDDGVLVDVTDQAKETGIRVPTVSAAICTKSSKIFPRVELGKTIVVGSTIFCG